MRRGGGGRVCLRGGGASPPPPPPPPPTYSPVYMYVRVYTRCCYSALLGPLFLSSLALSYSREGKRKERGSRRRRRRRELHDDDDGERGTSKRERERRAGASAGRATRARDTHYTQRARGCGLHTTHTLDSRVRPRVQCAHARIARARAPLSFWLLFFFFFFFFCYYKILVEARKELGQRSSR